MHKKMDLSDLTRSVLYEEVPNQNLVRRTIIVICVGFLLLLLWASITNINEVAKTKGEIIPSGYAQTVQHLEGGIINQILVEEGDLVNEGQILVRMGGIGAENDFASLLERQTTLKLQAERLQALAYNTEANFNAIAGENDKAISYQERLLITAKQAFETEEKVLRDQLEQRKDSITRLQAEKETANKELASGQELLAMKENMLSNGSVSKKDIIDSQREVNRLEGDINSITAQIAEAEKALNESQSRLQTLIAQNREKILKELEEVQTQIAQNKELLNKLESRVERQSVRSPVRGLVKGLRVNTIGGVIGAGEPIMEIVPLDSTLIVEVQIPPREVGNIQVGQPARVKVSAFDFSRYGVIEGELEFLSATTFINEDNQSYYKGRIQLFKDHVGNNPERNLILPGMTVEGDIITGQKTILAYLMKPIHTSLASAMTER